MLLLARSAHGIGRLAQLDARFLSTTRLTGGVGSTGKGKDWEGHGKSAWDSDTQTFHAGQDWMQLVEKGNFIEDFSVTTNAFGTPKAAEEAAARACSLMHHVSFPRTAALSPCPCSVCHC